MSSERRAVASVDDRVRPHAADRHARPLALAIPSRRRAPWWRILSGAPEQQRRHATLPDRWEARRGGREDWSRARAGASS